MFRTTTALYRRLCPLQVLVPNSSSRWLSQATHLSASDFKLSSVMDVDEVYKYGRERPSSICQALGQTRALFLTNSFNSLAQRAYVELSDTYEMDIRVELAVNEAQMIDCVERHKPDIIICPFLTKRIPKYLWSNKERPCLIVHPGIHGDRGASSIDWALKQGSHEWGVTILQADEEMDAGDIWATKNFPVPVEITKSQLYGSLVVDAAMDCLHGALEKFVDGRKGIPLNYEDPNVKGGLQPNMKISDRKVDFNNTAEKVAQAIRFSDSAPGAPCEINGHKVFVYNAHVSKERNIPQEAPGAITGKLNGAIRISCSEGSVWVTHVKGRGKNTELPTIKLPATDVLPEDLIAGVPETPKPDLFANSNEGPYTDIWVDVRNGVAIIHFPFLNGAMNTEQSDRLTEAYKKTCARSDVKVVVLAGGRSAWSNGINLNTIEASADPAEESWRNINAINNFVKAVFSETKKVTIAALQGNAGAGGAMAALACDFVWAHGHTVLNPHYKTMGLHGSEYWTYFLPARVGNDVAAKLTEECLPVSAGYAKNIGLVDDILTNTRNGFMEEVATRSSLLVENEHHLNRILSDKAAERSPEWFRALECARDYELKHKRANFMNDEYIRARRAFVYKTSPTSTPAHLVQSTYDAQQESLSRPMAKVMCGKQVAKSYRKKISAQVDKIKEEYGGEVPNLAVLMVGRNADSERYVRQKVKHAENVGIKSETHCFEQRSGQDASKIEEELIDLITSLNKDPSVNGIMAQLPLPMGVNKCRVLSTICATKDVDGFLATSMGRLAGGVNYHDGDLPSPHFVPCTAKGILAMLDYYHVSVLGKKVCVIGRSCIVGMPTSLCLMQRGATVISCDINTSPSNLHASVRDADVIIASAGSPEVVQASWIKPGAVVIDVGFHVAGDEREQILGDVQADAMRTASLMTPVPGGVGPMTVTMLLENTVHAFVAQKERGKAQQKAFAVA